MCAIMQRNVEDREDSKGPPRFSPAARPESSPTNVRYQGRGVTTREVEEARHGSSHPNGWHIPPVRITYSTGRMVRCNYR